MHVHQFINYKSREIHFYNNYIDSVAIYKLNALNNECNLKEKKNL